VHRREQAGAGDRGKAGRKKKETSTLGAENPDLKKKNGKIEKEKPEKKEGGGTDGVLSL